MKRWNGISAQLQAVASASSRWLCGAAIVTDGLRTGNEEDDCLDRDVTSQQDRCQEQHAVDCEEALQPALLLHFHSQGAMQEHSHHHLTFHEVLLCIIQRPQSSQIITGPRFAHLPVHSRNKCLERF